MSIDAPAHVLWKPPSRALERWTVYARPFFDVPLEHPQLMIQMRARRDELANTLRDPEIFMASDLRREYRTAVDEMNDCIHYAMAERFRITRERRIRAMEQQQLAISMGSHPRLGAHSQFQAMPRDAMREIARRLW